MRYLVSNRHQPKGDERREVPRESSPAVTPDGGIFRQTPGISGNLAQSGENIIYMKSQLYGKQDKKARVYPKFATGTPSK